MCASCMGTADLLITGGVLGTASLRVAARRLRPGRPARRAPSAGPGTDPAAPPGGAPNPAPGAGQPSEAPSSPTAASEVVAAR